MKSASICIIRRSLSLLSASICLLLASASAAHESRGTITVQVTDVAGAAVPGMKVSGQTEQRPARQPGLERSHTAQPFAQPAQPADQSVRILGAQKLCVYGGRAAATARRGDQGLQLSAVQRRGFERTVLKLRPCHESKTLVVRPWAALPGIKVLL